MKTTTKVILGLTVLTGAIGVAVGTPIVDLISPILSAGFSPTAIDTKGSFTPVGGQPFQVQLKTNGPTSFVVQEAAYGLEGHNGWHYHPGMVAVTLISGTIEWFDEYCKPTTYFAGDSWTEGNSPHYFRNVGTVNVQLTATYIIAKGEPTRIGSQPPVCAAAAGLE